VSNDVEVLVDELIDAICGLAAANRFTGLWDHVRFSECKRPDAEIRRESRDITLNYEHFTEDGLNERSETSSTSLPSKQKSLAA
jgi:hypothetical protein